MKLRSWFIVFVLSVAVTHLGVLFFTPTFMMGMVNLNAKFTGQYGELLIRPQAVAGEDVVVRTSPDLLYSACVFHLGNGAYRITVPPIDTYMSVSVFADNTDNIFALNDKQAPEGIDIVLAKAGENFDIPQGSQLVESDTRYGLVLIRYYLGDQDSKTFDLIRQQASCELLKTAV